MPLIFLTGGAGNLGKTVVETLLQAGHQLHLSVFSEADQTPDGVHRHLTDLTNENAVSSTLNEIIAKESKINAAVFLAGGYMAGATDAVTMSDIQKMIKLNFETAFYAAQNLLTHFRNTGGGQLIFTGARAAMENKTAAHNVAYALSKQLLYQYCNMINENEKAHHISAHILLPNTLDTALNRSLMPDADFTKWTQPLSIAQKINNIIKGEEKNTVIQF